MLILELIMIVLVILLNIKIIFHAVLLINWYVLMISLVKIMYYTQEKNDVFKFIQCIFNEYSYCKNVVKKNMSLEEEGQFEKAEICWICNKLIKNDKLRDHFHITGKCRGPAHWKCNINMKISKKLSIIFHNLRGYDSQLIIKELNKFKCNINVIPNGLEKFMRFS